MSLDIVQNAGHDLEVRARGGTRGNTLVMATLSWQLWQLEEKLSALDEFR